MTKPITIFTGASGLNTVDDPTRLPFKSGVSDLGVAVNVTIDQTRQVDRRPGQTLIASGSFHSLFADGDVCFVAKGGSLYSVASDLSLTGVRSGMSGARIGYCQAGARTYYSNGQENGFIEDSVSWPWTVGKYHGPDTNRNFVAAPVGTHLAFSAGRIFIATNNVLVWSELYRHDLFDLARSFVQFNTDIRMVKPVGAGLFVSTQRRTYFLMGQNPAEFKSICVANYPAIEWSDACEYVEGLEVGLQEPGLCAVWASPEGAILGTSTGQIFNLNKNKINYPSNARKGFGCMVGYQFLHAME